MREGLVSRSLDVMDDTDTTFSSGRALPPTAIVWDSELLAYNFGPHHPMAPSRLASTAHLAQSLGIFDRSNVSVVKPDVASDSELQRIHDADYIEAVRRASELGEVNLERGLGTEDDPIFEGMHEASARLVSGSLLAADRIISGTALHAVNFAGGMHHAHSGSASGFCIYNDAAAAVQRLLDAGVSKVAYIDVDAHHGDGTQDLFYNDPRVLTVSLHESGNTLFPGTGFADDLGGADALGTAVNIALPAYTADQGWLRAFHSVVPQIVRAFGPEVIVSQHGCDSHARDDLTHLNTSIEAQREVALSISGLARSQCGGRWIATGGGGYAVADVVPKVFTHLLGISSGTPISTRAEVPEQWREAVRARVGRDVPGLMGDDVELWWRSWEAGYNPSDALDQSILATRKEIFPLYGLDPWFD